MKNILLTSLSCIFFTSLTINGAAQTGITRLGTNALANNTTGDYNTGIGYYSLFSNTSGSYNTGTGAFTLRSNTTGIYNKADGYAALYFNTSGSYNVGLGSFALYRNTTGSYNSAVGYRSLFSNTTGQYNSTEGAYSLYSNTSGGYNKAGGAYSLYSNTTGWYNKADGAYALYRNTTGYGNTGIGYAALYYNTTTSYNTAIGYSAGNANLVYSQATFLGSFSRPTVNGLTNITAVGYGALNTASNQVRIGNSAVSSIGGFANWTNFSDSRFKRNIKADVPGLSFITQLNPVTYTLDVDRIDQAMRVNDADLGGGAEQNQKVVPSAEELKAKADKAKIVYTGFLAQEVKEVADKLNYNFSGVDVPKDSKGFYGIRYAEFVIPLVQAVKELNEKDKEIDELKARIERLEQLVNGASKSVTSMAGYLEQNTPNPVSSTTSIRYQIPETSTSARLTLTNAKGQLLKTISLTSKQGQIILDGGTLPVGTYNYSLWVDGKQSTTRRLIIAR